MINTDDKNFKEILALCSYVAHEPKKVRFADIEQLSDLLSFYIEDKYRTDPMYMLDED